MESWHSGLDVWLTDLPCQTWGRAEKSQNLWKMALATLFFWPKNWNISGVYGQNSTYGGSMESWHSGLDVWLTDLPCQTWGRAEKSQNLWKMALATLFFWPKNWNISGVYYQNSTYGGSGDRIHSGEQEILLVFYNICTGWASKGQKPLNSQTRFRKMALPRANQICPEQNQVRVIKGSVPEDFC